MKLRRFAKVLLALVVLVLALACVAFFWWRARGRPQREGQLEIAGLRRAVSVHFDERAVPHVAATNEFDAACALGWLHANERFGQMEMQRRYIAGTLSEVLGERTVATDRSMRELRLQQTAERLVGTLSNRSGAVLEAYASGVNAWIDAHRDDLPPELVVLGAHVKPWTPADSLGVQMLMALRLSYTEAREQVRFRWLTAFDSERTRELVGVADLPLAPEIVELAATRRAASKKTENQPESTQNGSNNWAVDASRSADGHALVANDPHLELALPSIWYQALLRSPEYEASGFSIPGLPLIVIGQSQHVGWGFTNAELDVCDVFIERVSEDGASVERDGAWVPVQVERAIVHVKDSGDVEFDLRSTELGPLHRRGEGETALHYSVAWTGYLAFDPLEPFLALARCSNVAEVPAVAARFVAPVQNLVCGDSSGAVLYTVLGRSVERGFGDGRMPTPAWKSSYHWRGLLPHEHTPQRSAPAEGLLVTANEDTRPEDFEHAYTVDAAAPQRAQRLRERLAERRDWTPSSIAELQTDAVSLYALDLVRATPVPLVSQPPTDEQGAAKHAFDALRAWNGSMDEFGASALYALYERELSTRIFADELRPVGMLSHPEHKRVLLETLRVVPPTAWFDDVSTPALETRDQIATTALARAWNVGRERWGDDVARWNYGAIHTFTPRHRLGDVPLVGRFFNRETRGVPGSDTSPLVFSGPWRGADLQSSLVEVGHGASLRIAMDCADPDRSLAILPGGQAGHPFDEHYADQLEPYFAGRLAPMRWSASAILSATRRVLSLVPAQP